MSQNLSDFFVEKAKVELREDENRKQQSFEILKHWSAKHSFIRILDPECVSMQTLLPFLRTKKYSMDKVYESIEKTLTFLKYHKSWSDFQGESLNRALALYDSGYIIVSKEFDSDGRKVVICTGQMDTKKFNSDDVFRLFVLVYSTLYYDEETQIGGIIYISDLRNCTLNYLSLFSIKDFYEFIVQLRSTPVRLKKVVLLGMPPIATQLVNVTKAIISDKMKKRLVSLSEKAELSTHVDISITPKEYGGNVTTADLIEIFRPKLIETAAFISKFSAKYDIDFSKIDNTKDFEQVEMTGTFRNLEID